MSKEYKDRWNTPLVNPAISVADGTVEPEHIVRLPVITLEYWLSMLPNNSTVSVVQTAESINLYCLASGTMYATKRP